MISPRVEELLLSRKRGEGGGETEILNYQRNAERKAIIEDCSRKEKGKGLDKKTVNQVS